MKKERNANVAYVATITALVEKPKRGKEKDVVKRMLDIGIRRKVPPWLYEKILNEIKSYPADDAIMISYYTIEHVRYRRVHHTSDEVNEKRLQRVYKLYDDYRAEKRKQKQKEI